MQSEELKRHIAAMRNNPYAADKSVAQLRAETEQRAISSTAADVTVQPVNDTVRGEWVFVSDTTDRVIYYLHGGAFYRGSVAASRAAVAAFSRACEARCFALTYRLAPEHPHPAALDDAVRGYQWLLDQGHAAGNIVISGISAGGGLAVATLLALREAGLPLPAGATPLSPWLDLTQSSKSFQTRADDDPFISKAYLDRMAHYYTAGADPMNPLISPLFGDLTGLPPMLVHVGSLETMHDESVAFVESCRTAGVDIEFEVWEGLVHGWHARTDLPEALAAIEKIATFCKRVVSR